MQLPQSYVTLALHFRKHINIQLQEDSDIVCRKDISAFAS